MESSKNNSNNSPNVQEFQLPDGKTTISIGKERYQCPEILFQPQLAGLEETGLPHKIFNSIIKTDTDTRAVLYPNMVLCGGTSMFSGFPERLDKEIKALAPTSVGAKVTSPSDRRYLAWLGASIIGSLPYVQNQFISKKEYEENGVSIVHRKCL